MASSSRKKRIVGYSGGFTCKVCGTQFMLWPSAYLTYAAKVFCPLCSSFIKEIKKAPFGARWVKLEGRD